MKTGVNELSGEHIPLSRNSARKSFVCVGRLFLTVIGLDADSSGYSLKRRGGCGINKKMRSHRRAADGVVSSAKAFRPNDLGGLTTIYASPYRARASRASARTKVAS